MHVSSTWQTSPHQPQFIRSVMRSLHTPEHSVYPSRQDSVHTPISQTWPGSQAFPHAPQFESSRSASVHVPWQFTKPGGHSSDSSHEAMTAARAAMMMNPLMICPP